MRPFTKVTTIFATLFCLTFFTLNFVANKDLTFLNSSMILIASCSLAYAISNFDQTYHMPRVVGFPLMTLFVGNKIPEIVQWVGDKPEAMVWIAFGVFLYLISIKEFYVFAFNKQKNKDEAV